MNIILKILVFSIVLFLYIHIQFHLKTSDDFEVFELTDVSKDKLEEVCDLRQPLTFLVNIENLNEFNIDNLKNKYSSFELNLRNKDNNDKKSEIYLPLKLDKIIDVFSEDSNKKYYSENNIDFLKETSLIKTIKINDGYFRPAMLLQSHYDFILGSKDVTTFLKYDIAYRNYFIVLDGNIEIKLTPPKSNRYLDCKKDYDNFEFHSELDPWNIQENLKDNFDKIKFMDLKLTKGNVIFIPAYWWYSIKLNDNAKLLNLKYITYMNYLAISPEKIKQFFQKQNIKHDFNISKDL